MNAMNSVASRACKQDVAATFCSQKWPGKYSQHLKPAKSQKLHPPKATTNTLSAIHTDPVSSTAAISAWSKLTNPLVPSTQKPCIARKQRCGWRCAKSGSFHHAQLRQCRFCASRIQTKGLLVKTPKPHALHGWQGQDEFRVADVWTPTH